MRRRSSTLLLTPTLLALVYACQQPPAEVDPDVSKLPLDSAAAVAFFSEQAAAAGLNFNHDPGASDELFLPEIMGSGAALFDYDNDGDLDVYLLQGGSLQTGGKSNRLFVNELVPTGKLHFHEQTLAAGLGDAGYGMGAAVGDIDNDGDADLYVTNVGANSLWRNNGDGTFTETTAAADRRMGAWSTSAAFADYDRDGDLDLFVANYVAFSIGNNVPCTGHAGQRDYCDPLAYAPAADVLWRNEGSGEFVDVTAASGMDATFANGLGVTAADFNADGWPDFYVANDKTPNHLWLNQGDGSFVEDGLISGSAYNADGTAEASMGVSAGDFDNDGDPDLFMTHLGAETNTLYRNDGSGNFIDISDMSRLSIASLGFTGFGTAWFDIDHDGYLDLFSANGAVQIEPSQAGDSYPYRQRNQLFLNLAGQRFEARDGGPALQVAEVSRGAAFGDIDNDGDVDIVVTNNNGPLRLLRNDYSNDRAWLALSLRGTVSNRDAVGARVALLQAGKPVLWRRAHTDGSYLSASDKRVQFGLGEFVIDAVRVHWPAGGVEEWPITDVNRHIQLIEGTAPTAE